MIYVGVAVVTVLLCAVLISDEYWYTSLVSIFRGSCEGGFAPIVKVHS